MFIEFHENVFLTLMLIINGIRMRTIIYFIDIFISVFHLKILLDSLYMFVIYRNVLYFTLVNMWYFQYHKICVTLLKTLHIFEHYCLRIESFVLFNFKFFALNKENNYFFNKQWYAKCRTFCSSAYMRWLKIIFCISHSYKDKLQ